jgi:uncharacterized protein YndB with AHSA1/START domain
MSSTENPKDRTCMPESPERAAMRNTGNLKISTPTDREIVMTRVFAAPRGLVFEALTRPELVKRWLLGPPGWSMPVCEIDLKVGGKYRYVWQRDSDGKQMGMGGVFHEIVRPERLTATEKFDEAWYEGECLVINALVEQSGRTTLILTARYDSQKIRDAVLKSGMESGVAASYDRLDDVLASLAARGASPAAL